MNRSSQQTRRIRYFGYRNWNYTFSFDAKFPALLSCPYSGASLYAMYKPLGQFKSWKSTLSHGLLGLVGMNSISLLTTAIIEPNIFSLVCSRVDTYIGLGLLAAYQAFDTQNAVQAYQDGEYDHLQHVANFFLNFVNLFVRFLSMFSQTKDNGQITSGVESYDVENGGGNYGGDDGGD